MRPDTTFFMICLFMMGLSCVHAQQFVPTLDSLAVTFTIRNGKNLEIQPDTPERKASAQRSTADLLYILDDFFEGSEYRKGKSVQVKQYWTDVDIVQEGFVVDSVSSAVYRVEIPEMKTFNPQLKTGRFLKIKSRPSKAPEQFFIHPLNHNQLILVSVRTFLYTDAEAFRLREQRINAYLNWLLEKYH